MKDFNMKKDTKITYFFQGGRKSRLNNNEEYAKEMFYGFDYFKSKYPDTEIIEFSGSSLEITFETLISSRVKLVVCTTFSALITEEKLLISNSSQRSIKDCSTFSSLAAIFTTEQPDGESLLGISGYAKKPTGSLAPTKKISS